MFAFRAQIQKTALPAELVAATEDGDLIFTFACGKRLQLHSAVACLWSKTVIKVAIASGCKRDDKDRLLLPMPDEEYEAWLHALPFMYSHLGVGPASVSWQSAKCLLLLGHKYNMPGITSNVLTFLRSASIGVPQAWEWLQLACNPSLELPDSVTQRCISAIVAGGTSWSSSQDDAITMQIARQLYNALLSKHQAVVADLAATKAAAAAKACEAAAEAKKQKDAAIAGFKRKCEAMASDIHWLAQELETSLNAGERSPTRYDWEQRDVQLKLDSIWNKYGIDSQVDEGEAVSGY